MAKLILEITVKDVEESVVQKMVDEIVANEVFMSKVCYEISDLIGSRGFRLSREWFEIEAAQCAKLETREVRLLRRNDMYSVGIFCKKCGSKLEVVDEFKEGTKKDWFVNPCEICTTRNAELPVAPDKDDTTNASWTECDVCGLIHDRKKTRCSLDILQRSS